MTARFCAVTLVLLSALPLTQPFAPLHGPAISARGLPLADVGPQPETHDVATDVEASPAAMTTRVRPGDAAPLADAGRQPAPAGRRPPAIDAAAPCAGTRAATAVIRI